MAAILDIKMADVNYTLSSIHRSHYGVLAVFMCIHPLISLYC
jgi:orotidine-5'-phosphate decarboxylase